MLIRISTFDNKPITLLDEVISLKYEKHLNNMGKCEFVLHYLEPKLKSAITNLFLRVEILEFKNDQTYVLRSWIINNIKFADSKITIKAIDYLWFLQYRLWREKRSYDTSLSLAIQDVYNYFDLIYKLPFSLWDLDQDVDIRMDSLAGQSFLETLKHINSISWSNFRCGDKLDIGKNIGKQLGGILIYNYQDLDSSNIISWSRDVGMDDFFNVLISNDWNSLSISEDSQSIGENILIEKYKYSPNGTDNELKPQPIKLPKIKIDTNKVDRLGRDVWDKKNILIHSNLENLSLNYNGIIQSIKTKLKSGKREVEIEIAEQYVDSHQWNLDKILGSIWNRVKNLEV